MSRHDNSHAFIRDVQPHCSLLIEYAIKLVLGDCFEDLTNAPFISRAGVRPPLSAPKRSFSFIMSNRRCTIRTCEILPLAVHHNRHAGLAYEATGLQLQYRNYLMGRK